MHILYAGITHIQKVSADKEIQRYRRTLSVIAKIRIPIEAYEHLELVILDLHKGRPRNRRSRHPLKENIQYFKRYNLLTVFYFSWPFLPFWIRIAKFGLRIRIRIRIQGPH
jgi:hypothetical protein